MRIKYEDNKAVFGYFEYEPDEDRKNEKLAEILIERYFHNLDLDCNKKNIIKKGMVELIEELSIDEQIRLEEDFREKLTEYFKEDAFEVFD